MIIRNETEADIQIIHDLQYKAFKDHPQHEQGAEPTEHLIVEKLRAAGALTISLVAENDGLVVGHIAISPTQIGSDSNDWHLLGPIGVLPDSQNKGIGSKLIKEALRIAEMAGSKGVVLVGNPQLYKRFGFKPINSIAYPGVPGKYVLSLPFSEEIPRGDIKAHPAFT